MLSLCNSKPPFLLSFNELDLLMRDCVISVVKCHARKLGEKSITNKGVTSFLFNALHVLDQLSLIVCLF